VLQTVKIGYIQRPEDSEQVELVDCKLLDCNTITQAKEKALDVIYANTPFTKRPLAQDVDLRNYIFLVFFQIFPNEMTC
jgi:hypothetical protein